VAVSLGGRWKAAKATARAAWRAWRVASANRAQAKTCFYCGVAFTDDGPDHRTVDHRVPRSRGGSDGLGNLVFSCFACNQRKRDRAEADFVTSEWLTRRREAVEAALREARPATD
jgi:5-methylcytosine-specific restriction endonuclease McrA